MEFTRARNCKASEIVLTWISDCVVISGGIRNDILCFHLAQCRWTRQIFKTSSCIVLLHLEVRKAWILKYEKL